MVEINAQSYVPKPEILLRRSMAATIGEPNIASSLKNSERVSDFVVNRSM